MHDSYTNPAVAFWRAMPGVFLVMLLTLWLVTGSDLLHPIHSNLTRADYELALAKWDSFHVTEYEQTFELWDWGKWKIVVEVDGPAGNAVEKVTRVESLDDAARDAKVDLDAEYFERTWTVGAMFRGLDLFLRLPYGPQVETSDSRGSDSYIVIMFDPTLGYPQSYTINDKDTSVTWVLVDVTVLKQSAESNVARFCQAPLPATVSIRRPRICVGASISASASPPGDPYSPSSAA